MLKRTVKLENVIFMKDWNNTVASPDYMTGTQKDTTVTSKWTGGFPSLNLNSLTPLSAPIGE
jgi:hypothetical protein